MKEISIQIREGIVLQHCILKKDENYIVVFINDVVITFIPVYKYRFKYIRDGLYVLEEV